MVTNKPGKQRKRAYNAPLHKRHKMMGACLSKELRTQLKRRTLSVRKGDEVKIMCGSFKGKTGKVERALPKESKVVIAGIRRKKASGEEVIVTIQASNVMITNPVMDDSKRIKK